MNPLNYDTIVESLFTTIPEYKLFHDKLINNEEYEYLAYIVFGPTLVWFIQSLLKELPLKPETQALLDKLFSFLEACASSGDEDLTDLIGAGFVEDFVNLKLPEAEHRKVVSMMGPKTREFHHDMYEFFRRKKYE